MNFYRIVRPKDFNDLWKVKKRKQLFFHYFKATSNILQDIKGKGKIRIELLPLYLARSTRIKSQIKPTSQSANYQGGKKGSMGGGVKNYMSQREKKLLKKRTMQRR